MRPWKAYLLSEKQIMSNIAGTRVFRIPWGKIQGGPQNQPPSTQGLRGEINGTPLDWSVLTNGQTLPPDAEIVPPIEFQENHTAFDPTNGYIVLQLKSASWPSTFPG